MVAGEVVELALRGFGFARLGRGGIRGRRLASPASVDIRAELLLEFFAEALGEGGAFAVGGDRYETMHKDEQ